MAIDEIKYSFTQRLVLNILSLLTIVAQAPYLNRFLPPIMAGGFHVDLLVSVIISLAFVFLLRWIFKPLVIPVFITICCIMLVNNFGKGYSFYNIFNDYKGMVQGNWVAKDSKQLDILSLYPHKVESYRDKTVRGIREKINYNDSTVRNFSIRHSLDYYDSYWYKYGSIVRYLSLFRYINTNFKYVLDSRRDEYFATPQETILNGLGGDCDDHSLLMTSCLQSIGARTRIVLIKGHAYPELYVGSKEDFEVMKQAIILFFPRPPIREIYYHELKGEYWINLDYSARHPGGPYLNDRVYALIEL
ncbi:transglutaminase domain-containing protein [Chitinophaga sp. Cy-1792]|uniref:transglutaminase domain-containing protein n=1 Tax=Chitinophaga sp. Cy-1792 TaxID=2608339 RepID=UPI00142105BF|nr:transglutaminase domain-containing protein [Chitinophaga sp. Cy-1792]NIG52602.1 transglutaminase domain-containing protein [Chitinophaga sp. Cy-1792]